MIYIQIIEYSGMYRRWAHNTCAREGSKPIRQWKSERKGSIGRNCISLDDGEHSAPTETNREQRQETERRIYQLKSKVAQNARKGANKGNGKK